MHHDDGARHLYLMPGPWAAACASTSVEAHTCLVQLSTHCVLPSFPQRPACTCLHLRRNASCLEVVMSVRPRAYASDTLSKWDQYSGVYTPGGPSPAGSGYSDWTAVSGRKSERGGGGRDRALSLSRSRALALALSLSVPVVVGLWQEMPGNDDLTF